MESGDDPLSQSLPSWGIDKLKKEAKCVYDSRIFNKKEDDSNYLKSCQQESKKKDKDTSFKEFLNASFNNAAEKKTLNKVWSRSQTTFARGGGRYIVDAVRSSRILIGKQKLGRTFNSDKLGGIAFTKISKLTMCSA